MKRATLSLAFVTSCVALAACGNPSQQPSTTDNKALPPAGPVEETVKAVGTQGILHATHSPAGCEFAVVATLHWDVTTEGIDAVELWVEGSEKPVLFAADGSKGSAQTGPWIYPATKFMLRAQRDGSELDRLVIEGKPCPVDATGS